jgi:hypothetical protein
VAVNWILILEFTTIRDFTDAMNMLLWIPVQLCGARTQVENLYYYYEIHNTLLFCSVIMNFIIITKFENVKNEENQNFQISEDKQQTCLCIPKYPTVPSNLVFLVF